MASPKEGGRMKIGFVGAGKVGVSFGKYFKLHKKNVIGYYSKNPDSAREAAKFTDTDYFSTFYLPQSFKKVTERFSVIPFIQCMLLTISIRLIRNSPMLILQSKEIKNI